MWLPRRRRRKRVGVEAILPRRGERKNGLKAARWLWSKELALPLIIVIDSRNDVLKPEKLSSA